MKIPKGERVWTSYLADEVVNYVCTSKDIDRSIYFLYKVNGGKLVKVSKSSNPSDFDTIVFTNNTTALS